MKKEYSRSLLVSIFVTVLFGCGSKTSDPTHANDPSTATIQAGSASALSMNVGSQVNSLNIGAGSFADKTQISLLQGQSLAKSDSDASKLIPSSNIASLGTTVLVASVTKSNASVPMTLSIPLPTGLSLADTSALTKVVILFKYYDYSATPVRIDVGYWAADRFTAHGVQETNGNLTFTTIYLGAYQIAVTKADLTASVKNTAQVSSILDVNQQNPFTKVTLRY